MKNLIISLFIIFFSLVANGVAADGSIAIEKQTINGVDYRIIYIVSGEKLITYYFEIKRDGRISESGYEEREKGAKTKDTFIVNDP